MTLSNSGHDSTRRSVGFPPPVPWPRKLLAIHMTTLLVDMTKMVFLKKAFRLRMFPPRLFNGNLTSLT